MSKSPAAAKPTITVVNPQKSPNSVVCDDKHVAIVLNCIDKRYVGYVSKFMDQQYGAGLHTHFYQVSLAGAALAAENIVFPDWGRTFREHVKVVKKLIADAHKQFSGIVIIDHRDCGAYTEILNRSFWSEAKKKPGTLPSAKDLDAEETLHRDIMNELVVELRRDDIDLKVDLWLMHVPNEAAESLEVKRLDTASERSKSIYLDNTGKAQQTVVTVNPMESNEFTIELWAKQPNGSLFEFGKADPIRFTADHNNDLPPFGFYLAGSPTSAPSTITINGVSYRFDLNGNTQDWAHYAFVCDGQKVTMYLNGQKVALPDNAKGKAPNVIKHRLRLGAILQPAAGKNIYSDGMRGWIDEVRVWDHARNADEIGDYRNVELTGKEQGLKIYYSCNQIVIGDATLNNRLFNAADTTNQGALNGFGKKNFSQEAPPSLKSIATQGLPGLALSFDGKDDYLRSSNQLPITGGASRTIEFWAKMSSNNGMRYLLSYGNTSTSGNLFGILHNNGNLLFHGHYADIDTGYHIDLAWHHYAFVYNGGMGIMYVLVDGKQVKEQQVKLDTKLSYLFMGGNLSLSYGTALNFAGEMAELRVWNKHHSNEEVAKLMYQRNLARNTPNLVLYYSFADGKAYENNSISKVKDLVGSNDGVLQNFAMSGATSNFVAFGPPRSRPK